MFNISFFNKRYFSIFLFLTLFSSVMLIFNENARSAEKIKRAKDRPTGLIAIRPGKKLITGQPAVNLGETVIANTTQRTYQVRIFPALLDQQLDGAVTPSSDPRDLRAANLILSANKRQFILRPGEEEIVNTRWNLLPKNTKAVAVGLIFESRPVDPTKTRGGKRLIDTITRILQTHYLRLPGKVFSQGLFDGQRAFQSGKDQIALAPVVKNTGQTIDNPTHRKLVIFNDAGDVVLRKDWDGGLILPGARRSFTIPIEKNLPQGRYLARTTMQFGKAKNRVIETPFELVEPNKLPTPRIAIEAFQANGYAGGPVRVQAKVRSIGNAPAKTLFTFKLFRTQGGKQSKQPLTTKRFSIGTLNPRNERPLDMEFGKLAQGTYNAVLSYDDPTIGGERSMTASLTVESRPSLAERIRDNIRANIEVYFGGLGLIVVILLLVVVWVLLRRDRTQSVRM